MTFAHQTPRNQVSANLFSGNIRGIWSGSTFESRTSTFYFASQTSFRALSPTTHLEPPTSPAAVMFRWLHSIGVFLIFLSALLLLVTSISAPVVGQIAMLKVDFRNPQNARQASILFGSFGHCIHLDTSPGIGFGGCV